MNAGALRARGGGVRRASPPFFKRKEADPSGTMLLVSVLAFVAFSVIPGDPTSSVLGIEATDEQVAALRARLGLDLPVWQRYLRWLAAFVTGDFGQSYKFGLPVAELLASRAEVTLVLAGAAFVLIVAISLPLGLIAARYEGGIVDRIVTVLTQAVMSVPNFVMGIGLMYLFALVLHLFEPKYVPLSDGLGAHLRFMLLVVEQVVGIPGLGRMLISSIGTRDYPVVQAIVVMLASVVVVCNFLADLLYQVMDPRIDGR